MSMTPPKIIDLDTSELEAIRQRLQARLDEKDYDLITTVLEGYLYLITTLQQKKGAIARLQKLLFGARTETMAAIVGEDAQTFSSPSAGNENAFEPTGAAEPKPRRQGHGRHGADAYPGAVNIVVPHQTLHAGDPCPECPGVVYDVKPPAKLIRFVGQAPVHATVYHRQRLRCNLCGKVFTAQLPEEAQGQKYDETVASMIGLLKYGTGMPFNRSAGLQGNLGIPLPASTQWEIVQAATKAIEPAYDELGRQGAQGDVVYNDDTMAKILELMGKRAAPSSSASLENDDPDRRGLFTSGIISIAGGHRIALFFTGRKHAGENLADMLAARAQTLGPPIQMCDALSRNLPAQLQTIVANCLAHARRRFVEVTDSFPQQCHHVLESLAVIYHNDTLAREQKLSPAERLQFHQDQSGPVMTELHLWLRRQLDDHLVEPNSGLGQAIAYLLKHWEKLTLFLRQPGAPLDNNLCERALKKAILHRKNALFYRTRNGAHVGDVYMSLIHTCELCGANPFDYLTELQRHAQELAANPVDWMPWNYQQTLGTAAMPAS